MPPAIPIATYRLAAHRGFRLRRGRRGRALSEGARHHPSLRLAFDEGAQGLDPRLRHRRSQPVQSRARRRGRLRAAERCTHAARPRPHPRLRARTMSACILPTIPGGSTCWNGARPRRMRSRSTSTGSSCPTAPAAACCCRSSARPMARRWSAARSSCATMPTKAASPPGISSIACRSRRNAMARCCAMIVKEADADESAAGKRLLDSPPATRACAVPTARKRPPSRRSCKAIAGAADIIARGLAAYRAGKDRPAQTLALHHLLERQHYKLGALAAGLQRHQLSPLLRRQLARGPARRGCRARSPPRTGW